MLYLCSMESENYKRLGKLLKEWRQAKGYTMYRLWKEIKVVRYDLLKKVEEGQGVNGNTLFAYIEFAYQNDFRVFENLFAKEDVHRDESDEKQQEKNVSEATVEEEKNLSSATSEEVSSKPLEEQMEDAISLIKECIKNKVKMSAEKQLSILKLGICPNCGSRIKQCNGSNGLFVGCSKFPNCRYGANGTLDNPSINNMHREGFIPLGEKK